VKNYQLTLRQNYAFLANVFTLGKRNVALGQIKSFISSADNDNKLSLDPKYEKYLPKSTLSIYKELKAAIEDANTLKSSGDSRNSTSLGQSGSGTAIEDSNTLKSLWSNANPILHWAKVTSEQFMGVKTESTFLKQCTLMLLTSLN
jgi:hypothetical protein